jgi:hypothetical protein
MRAGAAFDKAFAKAMADATRHTLKRTKKRRRNRTPPGATPARSCPSCASISNGPIARKWPLGTALNQLVMQLTKPRPSLPGLSFSDIALGDASAISTCRAIELGY